MLSTFGKFIIMLKKIKDYLTIMSEGLHIYKK